MNTKLFPEMAANIHLQDNRITHEPIFMVQQKHREWAFDTSGEFGDEIVVCWCDPQNEYAIVEDKDRAEMYREYVASATYVEEGSVDADVVTDVDDEETFFEKRLVKMAYKDFWVGVQPFFTEAGANEYIRINGHNLKEPRIYVESAFRNAEWQAVRAWLLNGTPDVNPWLSVTEHLPKRVDDDACSNQSAEVLIWDGRDVRTGYLQFSLDDDDPPRWMYSGGDWEAKPTHWKQLPKGPT